MKLYEGYYWPTNDQKCHILTTASAGRIATEWLPHVKGRRVAVQAGGNCGVFPLVLSKYFDQVYTFEPDADNFACLLLNCRGVENIQARCAAVHDVSGRQLAMELKPTNAGAHYVKPAAGGTVPSIRVDDLKLDACDLIALDVEGFEYFGLKGARQTIEAFHPTLIFEMLSHGRARYQVRDEMIYEFLRERGYVYRCHVESDEVWSYPS